MSQYIPLCQTADVPEGEMKAFQVEDRRILVANVSGTYYALDALCPHEEGYLDEGDLDEETVVCPIHYARFSLKTGKLLEGPAEADATVYAVRVEDGTVYVNLKGRS